MSAEPILRIGGATVDPLSRDATFAGGHERLQPQNLKVLIALARRKGQLVTRTELIERCWDARIVGEDVINHAISVLRAFAARAGGFTIETVPKAGYRLVESAALRPTPWWRSLAVIALASLAALAAAALLFTAPAQKQGEPPAPTVALAPFTVPAGDTAAAEVARASRASLSHMLTESGIPVRLTDARDAARASASDLLIAGDIEHSAGQFEALVTVEETRGHRIIFTHRFGAAERDPAGLPDQIGAALATNLAWTAALMVLDRRHPSDPAVTAELLKQMSITVEGGDFLQAFQIARGIAARAPKSAIAQIALAFDSAFAIGDLPREQRAAAVALGRRAADRAVALAPEFGDVYIPWCILHSPVRRAACETRLRRALKDDPDGPFVSFFLSALLEDAGRFGEALEFARLAIADDRYKPAKLGQVIRQLEVTGRAAEAGALYAQAVRWWPRNGRVAWGRRIGLIELGDLAALDTFAAADPSSPAPLAPVIAALRARDGARAVRLCAAAAAPGDPTVQMLCLVGLADLGQADAAFAAADAMYPAKLGRDAREEEQRWLDDPDGYPTALLAAPAAAALRRDPRFLDLARRLGLLSYWRTVHLPDFCRDHAEPVCERIRG